nr:hypothetical protein [Cryobacterium sandaracinum]
MRAFSVTITRRLAASAEDPAGVGLAGDFEQLHEGVSGDLLGAARVLLHLLCPGCPLRVDEPHSAAAGAGDGVEGGEHEFAVFGGEEPVQAHVAVAQPVDLQGAVVVGLLLVGGDAGLIEPVAHPAGPFEDLVGIQ